MPSEFLNNKISIGKLRIPRIWYARIAGQVIILVVCMSLCLFISILCALDSRNHYFSAWYMVIPVALGMGLFLYLCIIPVQFTIVMFRNFAKSKDVLNT